jgi:membrane protease YdiL (CAAX protease family)
VPENSPLPQQALWSERGAFLNLAGALEGGMALAAMGLAWLAGIDLWKLVAWTLDTPGQIVLALVPLLILFVATYRWPIGPLERIKDILLDVMGPALSACRWYDLPVLAALAGLGEELLFRGVMQTGLDHWAGRGVGLISASIVFGLVHAVTPTYALLAGLIGLYLGTLLYLTEPPNIAVPIAVHAAYDLVAFCVLRRDYRRRAESGGTP